MAAATTAPARKPVRQIEHQSLVDRVTDELHRAILNGDIAPGSSVSIVELCQQFGVSHIPVREALRRLESEGVLSLRPGRSALVAPLTTDDLAGIYRLRKLIEGELVERAGTQISAESLAAAHRALEEYARIEREPAALARAHHAFHAAMLADVMGVADHRVLAMLWKSSDRYLHLLMDGLDHTPERTEGRIREHRELLELAEKGDTAGLVASWIAHLDSSEKALLSVLAQRDADADPAAGS